MSESDTVERATASALRLLSYRPRSEAEMRARLGRRFSQHVVEQVISDLGRQDLLDDSAFARLWKDSRERSSPRSSSAIKHELVSKGIDRDIAEAAAQEVDDEESAYQAGLKLARRMDGYSFFAFRRKLWGHLHRRGFSDSVARRTINRLWNEKQGD